MQFFTLITEVKNYILFPGGGGEMLESLCVFIYSLNVQCVCTCDV